MSVPDTEIMKAAIRANMVTVVATALCVGLVAIGTGSLHCFWGLLLLLNIAYVRRDSR